MKSSEEFEGAGWSVHQDDGFIAYIGPFWERMTEAGPLLAFRAEEKHRNRNGVVQGGVLMTFADRALGMFARHATGGKAQATAQLDMHFISSAKIGEIVRLEPQLLRQTRSMMFLRGTLLIDDKIVATASGLWKLLKNSSTE